MKLTTHVYEVVSINLYLSRKTLECTVSVISGCRTFKYEIEGILMRIPLLKVPRERHRAPEFYFHS